MKQKDRDITTTARSNTGVHRTPLRCRPTFEQRTAFLLFIELEKAPLEDARGAGGEADRGDLNPRNMNALDNPSVKIKDFSTFLPGDGPLLSALRTFPPHAGNNLTHGRRAADCRPYRLTQNSAVTLGPL